MSQSLFTSQTPSGTDNSDGTPGITTGTTVRFAVAGTVSAIRFYATTTVSGSYTGALYEVTSTDAGGAGAGTLLASKVRPTAPTGGTWNLITLDTPVSVVPGVLYRAAVFSSAGRYVNTTGFFTVDLVNGDITADAEGDDPVLLGSLGQGTFKIDSVLNYPRDGFGSSSYFVDVDFTPTGGTSQVSSDVDLRWQVRETVSSSVDLRWAVRNTVSASADLRWSVSSVVAAAVDLRWALRESVSSSLDLRWAQRVLVESPLDLRWASAGQVASSIDLRWAVSAPVASTLDVRWAVTVGVSAPLSLLWVVRERASAPVVLLWVVEAATLPTERIPTNLRAALTQRVASNATPLTIVYRNDY